MIYSVQINTLIFHDVCFVIVSIDLSKKAAQCMKFETCDGKMIFLLSISPGFESKLLIRNLCATPIPEIKNRFYI